MLNLQEIELEICDYEYNNYSLDELLNSMSITKYSLVTTIKEILNAYQLPLKHSKRILEIVMVAYTIGGILDIHSIRNNIGYLCKCSNNVNVKLEELMAIISYFTATGFTTELAVSQLMKLFEEFGSPILELSEVFMKTDLYKYKDNYLPVRMLQLQNSAKELLGREDAHLNLFKRTESISAFLSLVILARERFDMFESRYRKIMKASNKYKVIK